MDYYNLLWRTEVSIYPSYFDTDTDIETVDADDAGTEYPFSTNVEGKSLHL